MPENEVHCPKCGRVLVFVPSLVRLGWVVANCECNPAGPVMEGPAKIAPVTEKKPKKEATE